MEQGLAQSQMGPQQGQGAGMGMGGDAQAMLEQVVQMLMQGANPEELLKQGVPMEILKQAIGLIMAQEKQAQQAQVPAATQEGLAMTAGM